MDITVIIRQIAGRMEDDDMEIEVLLQMLKLNSHWDGMLWFLPTSLVVLIGLWFGIKMLDFLTGLLKVAKRAEDFSSSKMRDGVVRWVTEVLAMIFVLAIDFVFGLNWVLSYAIAGLFVVKEVGSIFENFATLGVDIRKTVEDALKKGRKKQ